MKQLLYIVLILSICVTGQANTQTDTEIHNILKIKDSLLFERAFNTCETQHLEDLISEDFEFYHDIGGITDSKTAFIKVMENGICNPDNQTKSRRELVEGSLETFPLKQDGKVYGALQNGTHRFFETTKGKEVAGSIANFSHLWIFEDGKWQIKRVISFNHKSQEQPTSQSIKVSSNLLDHYIGFYKGPHTGDVKITKTENGLHLDTNNFKADIIAKTETLFFHNEMPLTFEFISDTSGKITKFIVRENNNIVEEVLKQ